VTSDTKILSAESTGTGIYDVVAVYGHSMPAVAYGVGGKFVGGYYGLRGRLKETSRCVASTAPRWREPPAPRGTASVAR